MSAFPARAFFQPGFMPDVQDELRKRGAVVAELTSALPNLPAATIRAEMEALGLGGNDLVAGLPWYVELALDVMGVTVPSPPDYPRCLSHLVRRRLWTSTLGAVEAELAREEGLEAVFVKPAGEGGAKVFSGMVVRGPVDDALSGEFGLLSAEIYPLVASAGGRDCPVHCSEVLEMNSEYAVYVADGAIRAVCHYMCKRSSCRCEAGEPAAAGQAVLELDMGVVEDAVRRMAESEETAHLAGYRADFVLARRPGSMAAGDGEGTAAEEAEGEKNEVEDAAYETTLCEVNDGYVSGRYDDCPIEVFTDMLVARWRALQANRRAV